jgi:hypothetical protein
MGPTERSPLEPVNRLGTLWSSDQPGSVAVVSGREEYRRNCDGRRRDNICYDAPPSFPTRCTSPTFPRCVSALSICRFPRFPPANAGGTVSPRNNGREGSEMRHRAPGLHLRSHESLPRPRLLWIGSTASLLTASRGLINQDCSRASRRMHAIWRPGVGPTAAPWEKPSGEPACLWKRKDSGGSGQAARLRLSCERRPRAGTLRRRGGFAHPANCTQQVQRFG